MATIKFTGEIVQDGTEFVIKAELRLPSFDQASEFGEWLHQAIAQHVAGKGGTLKKDSPLILN
jgi:hypothetical protein